MGDTQRSSTCSSGLFRLPVANSATGMRPWCRHDRRRQGYEPDAARDHALPGAEAVGDLLQRRAALVQPVVGHGLVDRVHRHPDGVLDERDLGLVVAVGEQCATYAGAGIDFIAPAQLLERREPAVAADHAPRIGGVPGHHQRLQQAVRAGGRD